MWLLDQWAERHIAEAQAKGEFDNLAGSGEPLILDEILMCHRNYVRGIAC